MVRGPAGFDLAAAAPLLCAGITTCSPLRHLGVGLGHHIGVIGICGLEQMSLAGLKAQAWAPLKLARPTISGSVGPMLSMLLPLKSMLLST